MKKLFACTALILTFVLAACTHMPDMSTESNQAVEKIPETMVVPNNFDVKDEKEHSEEDNHHYIGETGLEIVPEGGIFAAAGGAAAFITDDSKIALANIGGSTYRNIIDTRAERVFFDGINIFYFNDEGIFSLGSDGTEQLLTSDRTYQMWLGSDRIYYVRQDSEAENSGELWSVDKSGGNAIIILPEKIKGMFCIDNSQIYFTSLESGAICRSMLFGSTSEVLVPDGGDIAFTTENGLYYYKTGENRILERYGLRTASLMTVGAYADAVETHETVYVLTRKLNERGEADNLFTLVSYDGITYEIRDLITFENIGDDLLEYVCGEYVYLSRSDGSIYRIKLDDAEQNKEDIFESGTVFVDCKAYLIKNGRLEIYDLVTGEQKTIKAE